jgi:hypothetical protein
MLLPSEQRRAARRLEKRRAIVRAYADQGGGAPPDSEDPTLSKRQWDAAVRAWRREQTAAEGQK